MNIIINLNFMVEKEANPINDYVQEHFFAEYLDGLKGNLSLVNEKAFRVCPDSIFVADI